MILSILICTLPERKEMFDKLMKKLNASKFVCELMFGPGCMEIIPDDSPRPITTGAKRNALLRKAKGMYCVFIDDDDDVAIDYAEQIIINAREDIDCFAINGTMTTNGRDEKQWFIALGNPYCADHSTGKEIYLRPPNHLCPMKTEIARQIGFPDITIGEDFNFCKRLAESGLLKTQYVIEKPMYTYKFIENK